MKGFNFYQDQKNEWRWNLKDGNGRIIADSGEGYNDRKDCDKGAALFTTLGPNAPEHKLGATNGAEHGPEWEYYQDSKNEWRWRFKAKNNLIIADSAEGYDSESNVKRAIQNVKELLKEIGKQNSNNGNNGSGNNNGYTPPTPGGSNNGGRFA